MVCGLWACLSPSTAEAAEEGAGQVSPRRHALRSASSSPFASFPSPRRVTDITLSGHSEGSDSLYGPWYQVASKGSQSLTGRGVVVPTPGFKAAPAACSPLPSLSTSRLSTQWQWEESYLDEYAGELPAAEAVVTTAPNCPRSLPMLPPSAPPDDLSEAQHHHHQQHQQQNQQRGTAMPANSPSTGTTTPPAMPQHWRLLEEDPNCSPPTSPGPAQNHHSGPAAAMVSRGLLPRAFTSNGIPLQPLKAPGAPLSTPSSMSAAGQGRTKPLVSSMMNQGCSTGEDGTAGQGRTKPLVSSMMNQACNPVEGGTAGGDGRDQRGREVSQQRQPTTLQQRRPAYCSELQTSRSCMSPPPRRGISEHPHFHAAPLDTRHSASMPPVTLLTPFCNSAPFLHCAAASPSQLTPPQHGAATSLSQPRQPQHAGSHRQQQQRLTSSHSEAMPAIANHNNNHTPQAPRPRARSQMGILPPSALTSPSSSQQPQLGLPSPTRELASGSGTKASAAQRLEGYRATLGLRALSARAVTSFFSQDLARKTRPAGGSPPAGASPPLSTCSFGPFLKPSVLSPVEAWPVVAAFSALCDGGQEEEEEGQMYLPGQSGDWTTPPASERNTAS